MADLEGLIRLRKHAVDEKQKILSQLYRDAENLERQRQSIIERMEKEKEAAAAMDAPDMAGNLLRYLEGARKKIKIYDEAIRKIELRIGLAQEEIRAAFAEQKKIEIARDNRQERARAATKRKDDAAMDDIAIDNFRRKDD